MTSTKIRLGHYILGETLGVGSFGKVKIAEHDLTRHKVALKFINRRKLSTQDMLNRLRREIQYMTILQHPHVIKLYDVLTTTTDIIMVMEFAGGELFDYIVRRGKVRHSNHRAVRTILPFYCSLVRRKHGVFFSK